MDFSSHLSPMCSGGVTVTIIGVDVDAAVEPILTLLSGSNSTKSRVRFTLLYNYIMSLLHFEYNYTISSSLFCFR